MFYSDFVHSECCLLTETLDLEGNGVEFNCHWEVDFHSPFEGQPRRSVDSSGSTPRGCRLAGPWDQVRSDAGHSSIAVIIFGNTTSPGPCTPGVLNCARPWLPRR